MITVYGIKTCGSVRNALKFFKDNNIEVEFFDFKNRAYNYIGQISTEK